MSIQQDNLSIESLFSQLDENKKLKNKVKIIETNISLSESGEIMDSQSRVIEFDSWEVYVDHIKNGEGVHKHCLLGNLTGMTLPRQCETSDLKYTDRSLVCKVLAWNEVETIKTAYLIDKN